MDVFRELVKFQLQKENERISLGLPGTHAYDWKYTTLKKVPGEGEGSGLSQTQSPAP